VLFAFYAYRSLLVRFRRNAITMLAVCLFVAGGSMGMSFYLAVSRALVDTVAPEDIIVVNAGASDEADSMLDTAAVGRIGVLPEIQPDGTTPLIVREQVSTVILDTPKPGMFEEPVTIRGIEASSIKIHRATIVAGTPPAEHSLDLVLGKRVAEVHPNLAVGSELHLPGGVARIAGIFEAGGSPFEDEAWTPRSALQLETKETGTNSVTLIARDPAQVRALIEKIDSDKTLGARAQTVKEFRSRGAGLGAIAWTVFALLVLLGLVGTSAIATTMNATVVARMPELGALAAIGIRRTSLRNIVVFESVVLGIVGGALGVAASVGIERAIGKFQLARNHVEPAPSPTVLGFGIALGIAVGVVGGFAPAMRVRRLDILTAMRGHG
jgi:putative ABC transport system permease protein